MTLRQASSTAAATTYVMTSWALLSWLPLCTVMCLLVDVADNACPPGCTCRPTGTTDCSGAGLRRIVWNLPKPGSLTRLVMSNNSIVAIRGEIVSYTNLLELDLSLNQIHVINDRVFQTLPKLRFLDLQDNRLSQISERMFEQSHKSLLYLNLSKNEIASIEMGAFSSLTNLKVLKLANNRLTEIADYTFIGLISLQYLYINNNRLLYLNSNVFAPVRNLTTLLADMNSIRTISEQTFRHVTKLRRLSLEGNGLVELPEYLFSSQNTSPVLQQLSIKNNQLKSVPSRTLRHLVHLHILDLSHNLFILINPDAFKGLGELENLLLNNCGQLEIIRDYSFSELLNLQTVEISSNPKLELIEKNAFISCHNLRDVQLQNNGLTTLDISLFQWDKLDNILLTGNAWTCDCMLGNLTEMLQSTLNRSVMTVFGDDRCTLPQSLSHKRVAELKPEDYSCDRIPPLTPKPDNTPQFSSTVMIAIICTFAFLLLTCLGIMIWRTRDVTFHTNSRQQTTNRRRRLRKINREFSCGESSDISVGPDVVRAPSFASDKPFAESGPMDEACMEDDDVFPNDPDIVRSSQIRMSGQRFRKVSFSDRVVVRTYEWIEETEYFDNSSTECDS